MRLNRVNRSGVIGSRGNLARSGVEGEGAGAVDAAGVAAIVRTLRCRATAVPRVLIVALICTGHNPRPTWRQSM
jgi:hypothetical protein